MSTHCKQFDDHRTYDLILDVLGVDDMTVFEGGGIMQVPMKKKPQREYPLVSFRLDPETAELKNKLVGLGADISALVKPMLKEVFDQAVRSLELKQKA